VAHEIGEDHLDPTAELTLDIVKKRAVKGVLALTGRTFFLRMIGVVALGFLWAYLTQYEFGVFLVVSAIVNFLSYFSDIGLAAALIQKKETPTNIDLKTTFTVQQTLVLFSLLILYLVSPVVARTHSLTMEGVTLLYALGIAFFISSLKSIPSVLLERKLEFGKFIIPQVLEEVVYYLCVVFFAWRGLGITSFSYAVLIRGAVGLVTIYILEPWKPGLAFSKKSLKELLSFGLPYQANTFLAVMKDDGMTIVLGSILGPAGVGILGTAQRLAQYPLRFFLDTVTKVTFPTFSRMQDNIGELEKSVTRTIFFITFLVFPAIVGIVLLTPLIIEIIPRYQKWEPAILPLYLLSTNTFLAAVTTQLTNLLNATGRIKVTFKLMIMWSVLTWIFVPILSLKYGVVGSAVGYALVGASSAVAIYIVKRMIDFSLTLSFYKPFVSSMVMAVVIVVAKYFLPANLLSLMIIIVLGGLAYILASYVFIGISIIDDAKRGLKILLPNLKH